MRCPRRLSSWLWCRPWTRLPPVLWFLVASPLLMWATPPEEREKDEKWFAWPRNTLPL